MYCHESALRSSGGRHGTVTQMLRIQNRSACGKNDIWLTEAMLHLRDGTVSHATAAFPSLLLTLIFP